MSLATVKNSPFRSREEADRLVEENINLAYKFILQKKNAPYVARFIRGDDLESLAMYGLFVASRTWDPSRSKFSTFAYLAMNTEVRHVVKAMSRRPTAEPIPSSAVAKDHAATTEYVDARDEIRVGMEELTDLEQFVLENRFAYDNTFRSLSEVIGVSKERIRQIQEKALEKARNRLVA